MRFQPGIAGAIAIGLVGALAGCGGLPHSVGLAERCADIMKAAMPFAEIEVDKSGATADGFDKITATVAGTRKDAPVASHLLAAQCTFTDSVLTAFTWTKGGPRPRP